MRRAAAAFAPAASADDAVQEALIRAWKHRDSFDSSRGTARSWLVAITIRQAQTLRSKVRADPVLADLASHDADRDEVMDLRHQVRRLPRAQRMTVVLHYYVDLSVNEIAEVLNVSSGTVKSNLADARRALARNVKERLHE